MTPYERYIKAAPKHVLDMMIPHKWAHTSGIPLSEIQRFISDRIKDLDDQEIIRARVEAVPE